MREEIYISNKYLTYLIKTRCNKILSHCICQYGFLNVASLTLVAKFIYYPETHHCCILNNKKIK